MTCPKCHGEMHTYNRSGVQIEQCDRCRGIFLDYGELEALSRVEAQWAPPAYPTAPAWGAAPYEGHGGHHGHHGHHDRHHEGFMHMLFSS
jgi:uncharacterized protein